MVFWMQCFRSVIDSSMNSMQIPFTHIITHTLTLMWCKDFASQTKILVVDVTFRPEMSLIKKKKFPSNDKCEMWCSEIVYGWKFKKYVEIFLSDSLWISKVCDALLMDASEFFSKELSIFWIFSSVLTIRGFSYRLSSK